MLTQVNPISVACYESIYDFQSVFGNYISTVQDYQKLGYNLIHNLGSIWDDSQAIMELSILMRNGNSEPFFEQGGYLIGDLINQIAFKPDDYDPYVAPS
jgi:hypothetical protein